MSLYTGHGACVHPAILLRDALVTVGRGRSQCPAILVSRK